MRKNATSILSLSRLDCKSVWILSTVSFLSSESGPHSHKSWRSGGVCCVTIGNRLWCDVTRGVCVVRGAAEAQAADLLAHWKAGMSDGIFEFLSTGWPHGRKGFVKKHSKKQQQQKRHVSRVSDTITPSRFLRVRIISDLELATHRCKRNKGVNAPKSDLKPV